MRIVHFDSDSLGTPYAGGQARRTHEINKRLARRHDITVITAGFQKLRDETVDGVRYRRMLALPHPMNFIWYFVELVPRAVWAHADLIVEDFSSPLTASGLPMFVRTPVVGVASYLFGKQAAQRYHLPIDRWESAMVGRYGHIVALTGVQEAQLRASAPHANIRIIPNGADDNAFANPWVGDEEYIAFIGRLDWNMKGLDLLLDAAARLPESLPLVIAGDGPGRERLERAIDERSIRSRVRTLGRLEGVARHRFIAQAKALAFTSRYENQSLVGLDALAVGVPIVAFDVDSSRELFGDAAAIVPAFDVDAFAAALVQLAGDTSRAQGLSAAARARATSFTWNNAARDQEQFYGDALAREAGKGAAAAGA
jgi:glycosyltransferase involved in cell wall biosynthesis